MKKRLFLNVVSILLVFSLSIAFVHADGILISDATISEPKTVYNLDLPLSTTSDGAAPNSLSNNMSPSNATLQATFIPETDGTCSFTGQIITDFQTFSIVASGNVFYQSPEDNTTLYFLSGHADAETFSAFLSLNHRTGESFVASSIGIISDSSHPIQIDFGNLTTEILTLNSNAISETEVQVLTENSISAAAASDTSRDSLYRRTKYYEGNRAALSLFAPATSVIQGNAMVLAKLSADYSKVLEYAQELDSTASLVKLISAKLTVTSNSNSCVITTAYPASATSSFTITIPVYTGSLLLSSSDITNLNNYSNILLTVTTQKVTRTLTPNSAPTSAIITYLCGDLGYININMGNDSPAETTHAVTAQVYFTPSDSSVANVKYTATSDLTMGYVAETGGAQGVIKPLSLGTVSTSYTSSIS